MSNTRNAPLGVTDGFRGEEEYIRRLLTALETQAGDETRFWPQKWKEELAHRLITWTEMEFLTTVAETTGTGDSNGA